MCGVTRKDRNMEDIKPNNPPAYPCGILEVENEERVTYGKSYYGMELRDYFAGQALAALITTKKYQQQAILEEWVGIKGELAVDSYSIADQMLQCRLNDDK